LSEAGIARLRLSSVEPWDIRTIDLALWEDIRLCRHLHLPLQSGSDAVLERMGRAYTTEEYRRLLQALRRAIPDLAVTTDVIVGFPGESEADFAAGLRFVDECRFARAHVFPYSRRPGTAAATMPGQVEAATIRERAARMRLVVSAAAERYASGFVGRVMPVLWERRRGDTWSGLTSNYLKVRVRHGGDLHNRITDARIERVGDAGLDALVLDD
jgi:threonylcarbamoyladenosine tRNA methylthiotransferase MtaB